MDFYKDCVECGTRFYRKRLFAPRWFTRQTCSCRCREDRVFARAWNAVDRPEDDAACWLWTRCTNEHGYGLVKQRLAHRVAWERAHGQIPEGMCVLHRCDNPPCIRLSHLYLGDQIDNMKDRQLRGRTARGGRSGHAALVERQVAEIRRFLSEGLSCAALGRHYGVTDHAISAIKHGRSWMHIRTPPRPSGPSPSIRS